jgi:hypothetical protein
VLRDALVLLLLDAVVNASFIPTEEVDGCLLELAGRDLCLEELRPELGPSHASPQDTYFVKLGISEFRRLWEPEEDPDDAEEVEAGPEEGCLAAPVPSGPAGRISLP